MKLFVENLDTGSKWEMEIDADSKTVSEILSSDDWHKTIVTDFMTDDWKRKGRGYKVCGFDDDEISDVVDSIKDFFEENNFDVEDIDFTEGDEMKFDNEDYSNQSSSSLDEDYEEDLFDDYSLYGDDDDFLGEDEDDEEDEDC
jgi:hypothetical protein